MPIAIPTWYLKKNIFSSSPIKTFYLGRNLPGISFQGNTTLTELTIGNSVTTIGDDAFYNCTGLTSVTIPNSVTSIGNYAFSDCDGLTEIAIGNSVTEIGEYAFYNTLWYTNQPDGLIYLGKVLYAYKGTMPENTSIEIKEETVSISPSAFKNCTGLTSVTIGNSVTEIGDKAFSGCTGLTKVYTLAPTPPSIGNGTFDCYSRATLYTPQESKATYQQADGWKEFSRIGYPCILSIPSVNEEGGSMEAIDEIYPDSYPVTFSATPAEGNYVRWDDGNTDNPRTITITSDTTFTAQFEKCRTLTVNSADPSMGSVSGSGNNYCKGESVNITATPTKGYYFYQWNDGVTDNPRQVTVENDSTFTATFSDMCLLKLLVNDSSMGSVLGGKDCVPGSTVRIMARPNAGHYFVQWSDGNTETTRSLVMDKSLTLTAEFEHYRSVTLAVNDETMGSTTGSGTEYRKGESVTIEATPAEGSYFVQWNDGIKHNPRTVTVVNDTAFTAEFSNKCLLTLQVNDEAMGSVSGAQVYDYMATANIVATPAEGHYLVQWSDGNSETNRSIVMDTVRTYTATFERYRSVTLAVNDETMGSTTGSGTKYRKGASVEITATPTEGHIFVQWSDGKTNNTRTVVTDEDVALTAEFERYRILTVEPNNNEWGSTSGSGTFPRGSYASISATPAEGYYFVQWSDGYTYNPRTIMTNEDITLTAEFERYRILSATPNHESWGSLSGMNIYKKGEVAILTATPAERCLFKQWSDGNTDNPRVLVMTDDVNLTAEFAKNCIVTLLVNNESRGFIFGDGTYRNGQVAQLDAIAEAGCEFYAWSDGNTDNPRLLTVEEDITLTAFFVVEGETLYYQLTLQANDPSMGTVTGSGIYFDGTTATITATPAEGHRFVQWNDGNTNNPRTVTINEDVTYTAEFRSNDYLYTLSTNVNNKSMGRVIGAGSYRYGERVTIEAIPSSGYEFSQWSDGNTDNPRTVTVTDNMSLSAQFIELAPEYCTPTVESFSASNQRYLTSITSSGEIESGAISYTNSSYHAYTLLDNTLTVKTGATFSLTFNTNQEGDDGIVYTMAYFMVDWDGDGMFEFDYPYYSGNELPLNQVVSPNGELINVIGIGYPMDNTTGNGTQMYSIQQSFTVPDDAHLGASRIRVIYNDAWYAMGSGGCEFYKGFAFDIPLAVINPLQVTLNSNNPSMGTVTGSGVYNYGTVVTIEAIPSPGYEFRQWSDGNTDNPRELVVTDDVTLTATFTTETEIGGIDESELKIYATNGALHIDNAVGGEQVIIGDLSGRVIKALRIQEGYNRIDLDITGVYLVRVGNCVVKVHL